METNVAKNNKQIDVQIHNARVLSFCEYYGLTEEEAISAIDLLDNHLRYGYTSEVIMLALRDKIQLTSQSIRLIKTGAYKNETVFKYLLEVAAENKADGVAAQRTIKEKLTK